MLLTRAEFKGAYRKVAAITVANTAASILVATLVLAFVHIDDRVFHYSMATAMPLIWTPVVALPLVVMTQRLRRMKAELERAVRTDPLSGLPNRRAFFEQAADAFSQAGRRSPVAVMMIDIDRFKAINDRYGHDTGDAVLQHVAGTIARMVEGASAAGLKIAARIGGEEFAVMLAGLDRAGAARLAGALCAAVRAEPCHYRDGTVETTVSIGVAMQLPDEDIDEVLRAADGAVYEAKRRGRDQWCEAPGIASAKSSASPAGRDIVRTAGRLPRLISGEAALAGG